MLCNVCMLCYVMLCYVMVWYGMVWYVCMYVCMHTSVGVQRIYHYNYICKHIHTFVTCMYACTRTCVILVQVYNLSTIHVNHRGSNSSSQVGTVEDSI